MGLVKFVSTSDADIETAIAKISEPEITEVEMKEEVKAKTEEVNVIEKEIEGNEIRKESVMDGPVFYTGQTIR